MRVERVDVCLGADGPKQAHFARNGGGCTLEAGLGISPNGYSKSDFIGRGEASNTECATSSGSRRINLLP